mgnify:FL=1
MNQEDYLRPPDGIGGAGKEGAGREGAKREGRLLPGPPLLTDV